MTRWKVGTATGTGMGTLTTEPDGEVVLYDDVAELERRYREAVELLREAKHALYVADVIGTLPRDIDAFLTGEHA